ncbi:hypothetical protein CDL12_02570 [Handroanthus impetiginosus]|uniref:Uncharacterized protein n=1 Tax=Handroanthus impetiginosus TaxID=429701 RepID=A0A2G9I4K1_9LAMI|nr:hypothetical protein CDL12_02570 [Handroanthus impetiginosus]
MKVATKESNFEKRIKPRASDPRLKPLQDPCLSHGSGMVPTRPNHNHSMKPH